MQIPVLIPALVPLQKCYHFQTSRALLMAHCHQGSITGSQRRQQQQRRLFTDSLSSLGTSFHAGLTLSSPLRLHLVSQLDAVNRAGLHGQSCQSSQPLLSSLSVVQSHLHLFFFRLVPHNRTAGGCSPCRWFSNWRGDK